MDLHTAAGRFDLATQTSDQYLGHVRAHVAILIWSPVKDRSRGETGIRARQLDQHGALAVRQLELAIGEPRITGREGDAKRTDPPDGLAICAATEDRAHAGKELGRIARARDDVVGAELEERELCRHIRFGREHEHRNVTDRRELADASARSHASAVLQREIEDHYIRRDLFDTLHRVSFAPSFVNGEAGARQVTPQRGGDPRIVLDEKRRARHLHRLPPPTL